LTKTEVALRALRLSFALSLWSQRKTKPNSETPRCNEQVSFICISCGQKHNVGAMYGAAASLAILQQPDKARSQLKNINGITWNMEVCLCCFFDKLMGVFAVS